MTITVTDLLADIEPVVRGWIAEQIGANAASNDPGDQFEFEFSGLSDGDFLYYDGTSFEWRNTPSINFVGGDITIDPSSELIFLDGETFVSGQTVSQGDGYVDVLHVGALHTSSAVAGDGATIVFEAIADDLVTGADFAAITMEVVDPAVASKDAKLLHRIMIADSMTTMLEMRAAGSITNYTLAVGTGSALTPDRWIDVDGTLSVADENYGVLISPSLGANNQPITALYARVDVDDNITATFGYAVRIKDGRLGTGSASFDVLYGLYVEEQTVGDINYAIYVVGGTSYFGGDVTIGGASPANATLLSIEDGLTFKESSAPVADAGYVKIWSTSDNELFFQSGDGDNHLLHGDAFSNIWFHGVDTVEVGIATQNAMTKINSFTVVGHEDDLSNVVGSSANNNLTLSGIAGGEYEISFHASVTATGGADKEMLIALGITLATPKDITNVTDDTVTPIVITSNSHGLENGDMVEIVGVLGNTAANGSFIVDNKDPNTFEIVKLDGSATTGNGDFNEGSPTGDVTIEYPGNMVIHRTVRGADPGAISATGIHILANSDVLSVYVANLDGTTNLTVAAVSFDAFRIGD